MRRLSAALAILLLLAAGAQAAQSFSWQEGEAWFPQEKDWTYHYMYRYPVADGEGQLQEALNYYFEQAQAEMMGLVIPMYADDPIMTQGQQNTITERYELTRNDDQFISFVLYHEQTIGEQVQQSLRSVVFAAQGEYVGETLTLRGVAQVGESSQQLAEVVLEDVWRQIQARLDKDEDAWKPDLTYDTLKQEFYPETHFYADDEGRIVFYLQPGEFRMDQQVVTFSYLPVEIEALLEPAT